MAKTSNAKCREIASLRSISRRAIGGYEIEIVSIVAIEGGVEVLARAWQGGQQIGFGTDGTVDIERFRILNPPTLVPDGTKSMTSNRRGVHAAKDNFVEDMEAALLFTLAATIDVKKERFDSARIISGKRGSTTSTFFPSVDGYVTRDGTSESFSSLRGGSGTGSDDAVDQETVAALDASAVSNQFQYFYRSIFGFDTSALPDGDSISSATLSIVGFDFGYIDDFGLSLGITSATSSSNSTLANADYAVANYGSTDFATRLAFSAWNTAGANNFSLNASGLAHISKSGVTKFAARHSADIDNSAPAWVSVGDSGVAGYFSEATGTTNDPKLVVEHSLGSDSASVSPLSVTVSIPAVTATSIEPNSASVSPLSVQVTIPSLTATGVGADTASVEPIVITITLPTVTATTPRRSTQQKQRTFVFHEYIPVGDNKAPIRKKQSTKKKGLGSAVRVDKVPKKKLRIPKPKKTQRKTKYRMVVRP